MVRRLFQNYYASCGSEKQKLTRFISLLYKNRLDFYVATQNIDPIFITLYKNRPDFYYAKNRPDFYYKARDSDSVILSISVSH